MFLLEKFVGLFFLKLFSYRFSVRDDREPVSFMLSIIAILQTKIMRRRFQIGMGVNPSLIINKGIYIQHVDGGLYTKQNWSNKGYSNDLCIKKDYWGRENQNAYLEYDTSNTDYAFNKANSYLFKNGQNGYVGGAGEFFLISLYANEINECLLMVGGTIMSNRMWTSTRNEKFTYSWYYDINIQGDHLDTGSRGSSHYVRPFTELIL